MRRGEVGEIVALGVREGGVPGEGLVVAAEVAEQLGAQPAFVGLGMIEDMRERCGRRDPGLAERLECAGGVAAGAGDFGA